MLSTLRRLFYLAKYIIQNTATLSPLFKLKTTPLNFNSFPCLSIGIRVTQYSFKNSFVLFLRGQNKKWTNWLYFSLSYETERWTLYRISNKCDTFKLISKNWYREVLWKYRKRWAGTEALKQSSHHDHCFSWTAPWRGERVFEPQVPTKTVHTTYV